MAHRQLAEKYAKQLHEANQRIMELESAIADCELLVDEAKRAAPGTGQDQGQFVNQTTKRDMELNQTITNLTAEIELWKDRIDANEASAQSVVQKLNEQLKAATDAEAKLRGDAGTLLVEKRALELQKIELEQVLTDGGSRRGGLQQQLRDANIVKANQATQITELKQKAKSAGQGKGQLQAQINRLKKSEATAQTKIAALEREASRRPAFPGLQRGGKKATTQEVESLQTSLEREKKRRLEAEALLGPDGKRCKKCNPIIVDLDGDDGTETINVAQADGTPNATNLATRGSPTNSFFTMPPMYAGGWRPAS